MDFNGSVEMVFLNGRLQLKHQSHFLYTVLTIFDSVVAKTTGVCAGGLMIDKKQVLDVFADLPLR